MKLRKIRSRVQAPSDSRARGVHYAVPNPHSEYIRWGGVYSLYHTNPDKELLRKNDQSLKVCPSISEVPYNILPLQKQKN